MNTTRLSSKGQVIIPKSLRVSHHWEAGLELVVVDTEEGILLKPKKFFQQTSLNDVASCLKLKVKTAKTLDDMEAAILKGIQEKYQ